ncbi:hypothetical protein Cgig2_004913 [Carnegiea gigantea]|uniref:RING-type domain-containing protein n=1 Tax=Carnegiea gigantea TaxID=171969 RepID=A0A9Q1QS78_9CARY|nr:hypothetical protein Cgig2_004913 [Carnegiea gigantea]
MGHEVSVLLAAIQWIFVVVLVCVSTCCTSDSASSEIMATTTVYPLQDITAPPRPPPSLELDYDIEAAVVIEDEKLGEITKNVLDCLICLDGLEDEDGHDIGGISVLECGHRFHAACIDEWLIKYRRLAQCSTLLTRALVEQPTGSKQPAQPRFGVSGELCSGELIARVAFLLMLLWVCSPPDPASSSSVDGQSDDSSSSTSSYTSTRSQFQDEPEVPSVEPDYKLEAVVIDVDKVAEIAESCAECVICFESLSLDLEQGGGSHSGSGVKILGECGHRYHAVCINQWLTKHKDCPLCRRYVPRSMHGQSNFPRASSSRGGRSTTSYTSASSSQFQDEAQVVSLEPDYELVAVVIDVDKVAEIAESCAECVICFESLSSDLEQGGGDRGDRVKILGECGHKYHAVCIDQWLSKHIDCPLCRRHIHRRSR